MVRPNLFLFPSFPFFLFFSLLICAGNLVNTSVAEQHHQTPLSYREIGMPRPSLVFLTPMSNHKSNGIRAHNDRHTIANEPGNIHTHERPHPERHPGRTHRPPHHHPARRGHIHVKSGLTSSIPMDYRAAVAISHSRFVQNHNSL